MANSFKRVVACKDALSLSLSGIDFGRIIPGNICEEEITITNNTKSALLVSVMILCQNEEYEALDEYVYSIRKLSNYGYNEKIMVPV
jgi:hypothetical protein